IIKACGSQHIRSGASSETCLAASKRREWSIRWQEDRASPMVSLHKIPPEGETQMAYSLYDAAVTPCAQQLGALAGIIDKAAAHCATNKIEESALLQDRLYPDMFCLARQIRQSADFAM